MTQARSLADHTHELFVEKIILVEGVVDAITPLLIFDHPNRLHVDEFTPDGIDLLPYFAGQLADIKHLLWIDQEYFQEFDTDFGNDKILEFGHDPIVHKMCAKSIGQTRSLDFTSFF